MGVSGSHLKLVTPAGTPFPKQGHPQVTAARIWAHLVGDTTPPATLCFSLRELTGCLPTEISYEPL